MNKHLTLFFCLGLICLQSSTILAQHHKTVKTKGSSQTNYISPKFDLIQEVAHDYSEDSTGNEIVGSNTDVQYYRMIVHDSDSFLRSVRDSIMDVVHQLGGGIDAKNANGRNVHHKKNTPEPFTTTLNTSYFANASLLSISFESYGMACCGASGSASLAHSINVDLVQRKYLKLEDLVEKSAMHALDSIVRKDLLESEREDPTLSHPHARECAFYFTATTLQMYLAHSAGGHTWFTEISVPFASHPEYFRPEFVARLRQ